MTYSDKEEKLANKVGKMDAVNVDNAEMVDKMIHESVRSTTFQSRLEIQSNQSGFKVIRFNDDRRGQITEPIGDEDAMADVADIPSDADN